MIIRACGNPVETIEFCLLMPISLKSFHKVPGLLLFSLMIAGY